MMAAAVVVETSRWREAEKPTPKEKVRFSLDEDEEEEERRDSFFLPIQQHSRPATPADVVFERDVLVLPQGKTEKELNKHYSLAATDVGLEELPRNRQEYVYAPQRLSVYDNTWTAPSSVRDSLSRTSQSTAPTSCDSSEMQAQYARSHYPPSVMTNPRSLSSRPPSVLSSKSITSSIKNGFRRLSTLSRRSSIRVTDIPTAESAPSIHSSNIVFSHRSRRPSTSQSTLVPKSPNPSEAPSSYGAPSLSTYHGNVPSMLSPPDSPRSRRTSRPLSRGQSLPSISSVASISGRTTRNFSTPFSHPRAKSSDTRTLASCRPLTPTREEGFTHESEMAAAEARTARNRDLQRLRASQLQEKRRFLSFQREQYERVRIKHSDRMRAHKKLWREKEREMEERQVEKENEVEQRQLNAELDMLQEMEAEKKSVEARLRHMEGYVKGRGVWDAGSIGTAVSTDDAASYTTDGSQENNGGSSDGSGSGSGSGNRDSGLHLTGSSFPARVVTSRSMAMLGQQYRIRSQLPQLHASRINVLRKQQAKQFAVLQARHGAETKTLQEEAEKAADELDGQRRADEADLKKDFYERKERMEWRWGVAETMERRRLEEERGVPYAELQMVEWGADAWMGET